MKRVVAIRTPSGLSGDMLVSGLAACQGVSCAGLEALIAAIGLPDLEGCAKLTPHAVDAISGYRLQVQLPRAHEHRPWHDIRRIIESSALSVGAKQLATNTFSILAQAESRVHGQRAEDVVFHEVGALDSILDVCLAAALLDSIEPERVVCSPLPMGDGHVHCEHGILSVPAPAVQEMLDGVPIYGISAQCETVTPTALAFLRGCNAEFGLWPSMTVRRIVRAYGGRVIPGVPNGAVFALGESTAGDVAHVSHGHSHSH